MAHYIIVDSDSELVRHIEAKNMTEAGRELFAGSDDDDGYEATIYRVAGPPRKIRLAVVTETKVEIE